MGKLDTDAIPAWAVTMWEGDHDIFVALPMSAGGIPYILRFPRNEGGLAQALGVLNKRKREVLTPTEAKVLYEPPKHPPQVKVSAHRQRFLEDTTEAQRENARKVLAKLGIK